VPYEAPAEPAEEEIIVEGGDDAVPAGDADTEE